MMVAGMAADDASLDDQAAFASSLEPLLPMAFRLAYAMLRRREEAEDVVQEAALKAWWKRNTFRRGAQLRPWFLAIVANETKMGNEAMGRWLADAVRTRVATARPVVTSRRWIVLVAAALVAVLVAGIAGQRLLLQRQSSPIVPAATPSPHASPTPVDPFSCRLPVAIDPWSAPVDYQLRVGFLDTRTGKYKGDRSASVAGLAPLSS